MGCRRVLAGKWSESGANGKRASASASKHCFLAALAAVRALSAAALQPASAVERRRAAYLAGEQCRSLTEQQDAQCRRVWPGIERDE